MLRWSYLPAAVCVMLNLIVPAVADEPIDYTTPRQLARLTNPDITRSSGVAWSWENEELLWTHNDRGDFPRIFAFNLTGTHVAEYRLDDVDVVDVEDIESYTLNRDHYLMIADTGDDDMKRKSYALHIVKEPTIKKTTKYTGKVPTIKPETVKFTFEDGPQNCEALGVDAGNPKDIRVLLVNKSSTATTSVFEMPLPTRRDKPPFVAKRIATLTMPAVTGMTVSPDGMRAVLITASDAYEFSRSEKDAWAQGFAKKPRVLEMPLRQKGESIAYGGDGKTLYLTSEGRPCPLWMVPVRKAE